MFKLGLKDILRLIKILLFDRSLQKARFSFHQYRKDFAAFDDDLLVTQVGYFGHHVEKAIKHHNRGSRGQVKRDRLVSLLVEYRKRGSADQRLIQWAQAIVDYFDSKSEIYLEKIDPRQHAVERPELLDFLKSRTSTRFWQDRDISDEILDSIVNTALVAAPLSCNRQTIRVHIARNRSRAVGDSNNNSMFSKAPVLVYMLHDDRFFTDLYETALDVGSFGSMLMLAAKAYGIEGCWIYDNSVMNSRELRKKLGLRPHYRIYSTITLGYPLDQQEKPPRISNIVEART
jgi:nitroreductase